MSGREKAERELFKHSVEEEDTSLGELLTQAETSYTEGACLYAEKCMYIAQKH